MGSNKVIGGNTITDSDPLQVTPTGGAFPILLERKATIATATIRNGDTASDAVSKGLYAISGIIMPAAFTGTSVTFTVCATSTGTFVPLYDSTGTIVAATTVGTSRAIDCPTQLAAFPYFKIVSGSTELADRAITVCLVG